MKQDPLSAQVPMAGSPSVVRPAMRRAWSRGAFSLACVLLVGLLAGCSDSDDDPGPTGPSGPVTLFGVWQGSMTAERTDTGEQMSCSLTMELVEASGSGPETGIGNWEVFCPDGTNGGDIATATRVLFELVIVNVFPGDEPFAGCSWGGTAELTSGRLTGDWSVPNDCAEPWQGSFDLAL